jgi:hypothetical protein
MSWYTIGWIGWGLAFAALELPALLWGRTQDTLSGHVWAWFHVRDARPTVLTWTLRAALLAFLVWLTVHLTLGIWPSS